MEGHVKKSKIDAGTESRIVTLENRMVYYETYESIATGTGGKITVATGATILLDRYEDAGDCLIVKTDSAGRPIDEIARTAAGNVITSTLDIGGNFLLSGEPSAYPVAIVYQIEIPAKYSENVLKEKIVEVINRLRLEETEYDNTSSGLDAKNGQDAIDELQAEKEPNLPATPVNPSSKYLNGNREWSDISIGSGGYASNLYFTETASAIVPTYKQLSYILPATETIKSVTVKNTESIIESYIFDTPIGFTNLDAGSWFSTLYAYVSSIAGISNLKMEIYKRTAGGVETKLFEKYSLEIENTVGQYIRTETIQNNFVIDATDYLVVKVYGKTTATANRTIYYVVGDGNASYVNTPLALRHSQLRGKNDEDNFQHVTSTEKAVIIDNDMLAVRDATTTLFERMKWSNIKTAIKTYYDSVTATLTNKTLTSPVINTAITGTAITATGEASKLVKTDALGDIYERGNRVAENFKANYNKSSIFLNGTNAYISVANNDNINFGTGTFSYIGEHLFESGSVTRYKVYKTASNVVFTLYHGPNNKVVVWFNDGTNSYTITSTNTLADGKFHVVGFVKGIDSASSKLYIDGIEDTTAVKSGTFPTGTLTTTATMHIGSTIGAYHKNETRLNRLFNYALTASQIQKYSYDGIAYEDVGGNNTDLTAGNGSFATDTTSWWTVSNGTLTWNSGTQNATFVSNGITGFNQFSTPGSSTTSLVGKRYRISFKAKSSNLTSTIPFVGTARDIFMAVKNQPLTATEQTYIFEGFAANSGDSFFIRIGTNLIAGQEVTFDDIIVQRIGCVLDLTSGSIANTGWFDKSGNNLHATYTNALPFNLQSYKPRIQGYSADMRGANVASATTITPTGELFHVTGTTAIATINVPYTAFNGSIIIIPDGIFTWTTAGNIALAGTAVVSKALRMTYDATTAKWYPDYTA